VSFVKKKKQKFFATDRIVQNKIKKGSIMNMNTVTVFQPSLDFYT